MAVKLRISRNSPVFRILKNPWGRTFIIAFLLLGMTATGVFSYYYLQYSRMIDGELKAGPFSNATLLYASPRPVLVGEQITGPDIAAYLRQCGYSQSNTSRMGWYLVRPDAIEVNPGPDAYDPEGAVIKIAGGKVNQIISLRDHTERTQYLLEPELISNLYDKKREKRRIVAFDDIPKVMVNAVLAAEDKHFFSHAGFDPIGIVRAAWRDLMNDRRLEGASTISQQLARTLWLGTERGWRRKIPETMITMQLEQKLTKQQIFYYYANSIYLGNQGSFSIHGFGEGSQVYLGKDLSKITVPEAAMLAGLIQSPGGRNPFSHPDRALARRNIVLKQMRENDFITDRQYQAAVATPLQVNHGEVESSDAPYFVDLVNDELQSRFQDRDFYTNSSRVYTTLDLNLQRDLVEAVRAGILETDQQWRRRNKKYGTGDFPLAQVAAIALSAETGEPLAVVGGRSYGVSQLNRVSAKRQPGSSFKPFVYTAAMMSALDPASRTVLTPASMVVDEETTFWYENGTRNYTPNNFGMKFEGPMTLRYALAHSKNVPAVKVAEMVGFDKVAEVARAVGMNLDIQPTPSIALGAYEVTPLEIASAYTVFPNGGNLLKSGVIKGIRDGNGATTYQAKPERKQAIDPRVAYLVESMMEDVLRGTGTGARARSMGFVLPAAGKTGTSRDGWFAGFTSKIICVVWVGFDDNRDFKLEGAKSALPIWVEFMKRAHQHQEYKNVHSFQPPDGIVTVDIDEETGELATPSCPKVRSEVFIAGSQPLQICHIHGSGRTLVSGWDPVQQSAPGGTSSPESSSSVVATVQNPQPAQAAPGQLQPQGPRSIPVAPPASQSQPEKKKKGFFGRLKDIFQ
ncbi:MAG: penicillin-binding protein family [Bryobacterales bacterium]|nr:penicillin-binding protein family [Bryobacterales bacterium]